MQSNQQFLYWGTQQLMLRPKISYQEAKQEPIFLTMALIFLTLDPLEGSVMALTVQIFLIGVLLAQANFMLKYSTCHKTRPHVSN